MESVKRDYSIDLLRIILMVLIVMGHCCAHTGIRESVTLFSFDWFSVWVIQTITTCAVNVFVLITGYFYDVQRFSAKKVTVLWSTVSFVSLISYVVSSLVGKTSLGVAGVIKVVFPILSKQYWFFTMYFLLMLLAPFIIRLLKSLSIEKHRILIIIVSIVFYVLPLFSIVFPEYDAQEGYSIIGFIALFIIGAYIKRIEKKFLNRKKFLLLSLLLNSLIMILSKVCLEKMTILLSLNIGTGLLYHINTVFQLMQSVILFLLVANTHIKSKLWKSIITCISSKMFVVYLIHDNPNLRPWIWGYIVTFFKTGNVIWVVIVSSIVIFSCATILSIVIKPALNIYTRCLIKVFGEHRLEKLDQLFEIEMQYGDETRENGKQ